MPTPVTDPALLAQLEGGGPKPVTDPALLEQLEGKGAVASAFADVGPEIAKSFNSNLEAIKNMRPDPINRGGVQGILDTGKGLLAIPGAIASPVTGTVRALGGPAFKGAVDAATSGLQGVFGGKREELPLETAKGDVETAFMAARPRGVTPTGVTPVAPKPPPAPAVTELKDAARANYRHPTVQAVEINPASTANLSAKIENDLLKQGFRPKPNQGGPVFDEVKDLVPSAGVTSVRIDDIDSARKALGRIADNVDAVGKPTADAVAARTAIEHINDYLPKLSKSDVIAGDATAAAKLLDEARGNWAAAKRAEQVDLQLTRAERQAAKSGTGGNIENAMRQKIATILDNPKRTVGFSAAEKQAMEDIVRGTKSRNALRMAGKLGVDGGLSLLLNTGAAIGSGGATIPVTAAGTIARILGQRSTAKAGRGLSELVRNRSPLSKSRMPAASVPKINRASAAALISQLLNNNRLGIPGGVMPAHADQEK